MPRRGSLVVCLCLAACGCATAPANRSFNLSPTDARHAIRDMRREPRPLQRPVVVLGGLNDPGVAAPYLADQLRRATGDDRVIAVSFFFCDSLDACRRRLIDEVDRAFPAADAGATREVDVVAVSMGGVVARHAAAVPPQGSTRRLRMARLFTISTPHRGASLAELPALPLLGQVQLELRPRSAFLRQLEARESKSGEEYELVPYVRLGDVVVGEANASPRGRPPVWVPNLPLEDSHLTAFCDPRIVADIARRLRGEEPFATLPAEPLPGE